MSCLCSATAIIQQHYQADDVFKLDQGHTDSENQHNNVVHDTETHITSSI
jgi:hypothetical protein